MLAQTHPRLLSSPRLVLSKPLQGSRGPLPKSVQRFSSLPHFLFAGVAHRPDATSTPMVTSGEASLACDHRLCNPRAKRTGASFPLHQWNCAKSRFCPSVHSAAWRRKKAGTLDIHRRNSDPCSFFLASLRAMPRERRARIAHEVRQILAQLAYLATAAIQERNSSPTARSSPRPTSSSGTTHASTPWSAPASGWRKPTPVSVP
jgi:hypothetical protein